LDQDGRLPLYQYMNSLLNSRELEPLLQTWLLFGLLSEFFGGNVLEKPAPDFGSDW
jgi:hypothetical protein